MPKKHNIKRKRRIGDPKRNQPQSDRAIVFALFFLQFNTLGKKVA